MTSAHIPASMRNLPMVPPALPQALPARNPETPLDPKAGWRRLWFSRLFRPVQVPRIRRAAGADADADADEEALGSHDREPVEVRDQVHDAVHRRHSGPEDSALASSGAKTSRQPSRPRLGTPGGSHVTCAPRHVTRVCPGPRSAAGNTRPRGKREVAALLPHDAAEQATHRDVVDPLGDHAVHDDRHVLRCRPEGACHHGGLREPPQRAEAISPSTRRRRAISDGRRGAGG